MSLANTRAECPLLGLCTTSQLYPPVYLFPPFVITTSITSDRFKEKIKLTKHKQQHSFLVSLSHVVAGRLQRLPPAEDDVPRSPRKVENLVHLGPALLSGRKWDVRRVSSFGAVVALLDVLEETLAREAVDGRVETTGKKKRVCTVSVKRSFPSRLNVTSSLISTRSCANLLLEQLNSLWIVKRFSV